MVVCVDRWLDSIEVVAATDGIHYMIDDQYFNHRKVGVRELIVLECTRTPKTGDVLIYRWKIVEGE